MSLLFIITLVLTLVGMPFFIKFMREKQFGQVTRDEGPAWHKAKSGTPAMGGVVFLSAAFIGLLIWSLITGEWHSEVWLLVATMIFFAAIGFTDDFLKIFKKQNEGLTSLQKLILQIVGSALIVFFIRVIRFHVSIPFPFTAGITNVLFVFIFLLIWITGFSNAFNLTDGLDGLSSGLGVISFSTYAYIAFSMGERGIGAFCIAIVAGLLGFLFFNRKPAKIFMGDAGSLSLGALLAVISVMLGNPWSLLLIGLVYVIETASVIIQVTSFKLTGKRVFKMSPIHHHFEMIGWSEWKVDIVFWIVGLIAALIGVLLFK
ncbi:phospho-N-acetylmuramoyl-pentapeptide-transferase [Aerococcus agrisoli]|uniref:Phospho-N-acetylmuramoyl-pentapeptide-transferase n=1 Tax=Aerococcus agrisoli TaxID=2487350 RepID=A0A3N4GQD9_9LACT|nr:phospho-N-acetylmuramoyl-pentapeptide-transferase [Aerococcus agrisoli]RPA60830.1 phospho-N-acetylmuramoyl-pentapeptide-transferase [Aerococcus agrisoli]